MRKRTISLLFMFQIILINLSLASAYIEPGTGGIVITSIWPIIIGFFVAIGAIFTKMFFQPIRTLFSKILVKTKK